MRECNNCDCYDPDFGCVMPSIYKWYACLIESKRPENQKMLKEMAEQCKSEGGE